MNRPLIAIAAVVLTLLSMHAILTAQRTAITGVVRDESGDGLSGVTLTITHGNLTLTAVTAASGAFALTLPEGGDYDIRASLAGFVTARVRVTVQTGQTQSADLRLVLPTLRAAPAAPDLPKTSPSPPPPPVEASPSQPTRARPPAGADQPPAQAGEPSTHATITVYFATDRNKGTAKPLPYGPDRSDGSLHLGQVDVHVPREHRVGYVERPAWWRLWRENKDKDFVITRFEEQQSGEFFLDLRATIGKSSGKQAFVFVHGFNVPFDAAVYRTAQLAYDLDFDGAPILYSWPSEGKLTGYPTDLNNNEWTVDHLSTFLRQVSAESGAQTVHLIAHSMGNRALVNALAQLAASPAASQPHFNQVVLTAPDIDASIFRTLAVRFQPLVARATLYASSKDEALVASKTYQGYQRAGDTEPSVVIVPGMDTIDVSNVDSNLIGHFYYGDNRSVISDLKNVLDGMAVGLRSTLRPVSAGNGSYWTFKP
jgi:esterase/lipase superfamily enzyme